MTASAFPPIEIRASKLPLAFHCPGSTHSPSVPVSDDGVPARLGRAVHEILRSLAETDHLAWGEIDGVALRHGVDPAEAHMLCGIANKMWPMLRDSFPDALTEVSLSAEIVPGLMLTGHADLLTVKGTAARIADWKTGRRDRDYSQQMRGYAALVLAEDPQLEQATATVIWLRDREIENYTMTREQMRAWVRDLCDRILGWDGTYHPGQHCLECPMSHECAAANALVRRDVAVISDRSLVERMETDLATMAPADVLELFRKADLVAYFANRVRAAIKAHVMAHGDVMADGVRLTVETQDRRELDPLAAWPILEALGLTQEELAACVDLPVTRLEGVVAKHAGRGKGAAAVRELSKKLADAHAVSVKQTHCLKEKRTP